MIDIALMLSRDYAFDRKGILTCIRDLGDEVGLMRKYITRFLISSEK